MASRSKTKEKIQAGGAVASGSSTAMIKSPPNIEIENGQRADSHILPAKITEEEWSDLISAEEGVEICLGILDEVVDKAAATVLDHYLEQEIFPFSVREAKKSILKIIALEFVARDEGERDTANDPTWHCDEPPVPAPIDSWARGTVPLSSREDLHSPIEALDPILIHQPVVIPAEAVPNTSTARRSCQSASTAITSSSITSSTTASKTQPAKRKKWPHPPQVKRSLQSTTTTTKRLQPQAKLVSLDHPPEKARQSVGAEAKRQPSQSLTPVHSTNGPSPTPDQESEEDHFSSHHPPGFTHFGLKPAQLSWLRDVKFDKKGNLLSMTKLDPAKFLSRRLKKPEVSITYSTDQPQQQRVGHRKGRAKVSSLPAGRPPHHPPHLTPKVKGQVTKAASQEDDEGEGSSSVSTATTTWGHSVGEGQRYARRDVTVMPSDAGLTKKDSRRRFPSLPALPSLVDTIDPLPGVTVREGNRSVHGPTPHFRPTIGPQLPLRPVRPLEEESDEGSMASQDNRNRSMYTEVVS